MRLWDDAQVESAINANYAVFERLVEKAEDYLKRGRNEAAATYAQIAAHYAWRNHPGVFASCRLEQLLLQIGEQVVSPGVKRTYSQADKFPARVLHVLTATNFVGGHTRLAARWIEQDSDRVHSVALTRQERADPPDFLKEGVLRANGQIHVLDEKLGGLQARARALRKLSNGADLVVLHIHPYDVVPIIAFADRATPPVVFLNHADHVFWLGTHISDLVAHTRESTLEISHTRRGIPPERCFVLPIPLQAKRRSLSRVEAKRHLGLDPSTILLLTVATEYKFKTSGDRDLASVVVPVLDKHRNAQLLAVGPSQRGGWAQAGELTQGRVKALGIIEDPSKLFEAADIYLDSFPFGSLTSLLEAGSYGVALINSHPYSRNLTLLRCDDLALPSERSETNIESYQQKVSTLIEHAVLRDQLGDSVQRNIHDIHMQPGWKQFVEALYERARIARSINSTIVDVERRDDDHDRALIWMQTTTGSRRGLDAIKAEHFRLLPAFERFTKWTQMKRTNPTLTIISLISESIGSKNDERLARFRRFFKINAV